MSKAHQIASVQNERVRAAVRLKLRRYRAETGCFLVEGPKVLEEALRARTAIHEVFISEALLEEGLPPRLASLLEASSARVQPVSAPVLKRLADSTTPQGIVAVAKAGAAEPEGLALPPDAFAVICDRVQDPGNLGAIIRVADAAGVDAVLVSAGSCDPYNPKTVRATMGSLFHLPVVPGGSTVQLIRWMQSKGVMVAGASPRGTVSCYEVRGREALCWVLSNEARGASAEVLSACDAVVRIPMPGHAESLNVAAAASILMYEVVRQRAAEGFGTGEGTPGKTE